MSILVRLKSDAKLQVEALDVIDELIRRDLLRIDVLISNVPAILSCRPSEVYVTGGGSATSREVFRTHMAGSVAPLPERKPGLGITVILADKLRLSTEDDEVRARRAAVSERAADRPPVSAPVCSRS